MPWPQLSLPADLLVKDSEVPRQCHSTTGALGLEKGRPPRFFWGFKPHRGGLYSTPLLHCGLSAWEKFCFEENFHPDRLTHLDAVLRPRRGDAGQNRRAR